MYSGPSGHRLKSTRLSLHIFILEQRDGIEPSTLNRFNHDALSLSYLCILNCKILLVASIGFEPMTKMLEIYALDQTKLRSQKNYLLFRYRISSSGRSASITSNTFT